jgi:perosamine synthetase
MNGGFMAKLALLGGKPVRAAPFRKYNSIGKEEEQAALRVVRSGVLSGYYGSNCPEFYGGENVRGLEREWAAAFGAKHACATNSATSALSVSIGAAGISPGDEVIVTPYSMSATATAILHFGGIPVFADIEDEYFGLDPKSVEKKITPRTKAVMVTNLFGHAARLGELKAIADRHNLILIEDCAQSPGAVYQGKMAGTIGHMGIFSLNCHKNIQTGEGGVLVTDDRRFAKRSQLIRNHAEAVIGSGMEVDDLSNMVGHNYRMTELEAAVGREQLKKLGALNAARQELCLHLSSRLAEIKGLVPPRIGKGATHVFYVYPLTLDRSKIRIGTGLFARALAAEGMPFRAGYTTPIYLLPMYAKRIAYGHDGYPFSLRPGLRYSKGDCPVVEEVEAERLLLSENITPPNTIKDIDDAADAFAKVVDGQDELLGREKK